MTSISEMLDLSKRWRLKGKRIGLIPTMGCFHEGHLSLMSEAGDRCDKLVVSLFVNPIQFGPNEDFAQYPRDLERDMEKARKSGVDILYHPSVSDMYGENFQTSIRVDHLSVGLCGGSRPGHFDGVCTVVAKFFNQVQPHVAVFGEKDFQQLAVIKRMVKDLNADVEIVAHSIVREPDGLAMSSRNSYLSNEERQQALCLYEAISYAQNRVRQDPSVSLRGLESEIKSRINSVESCSVDYVAIVDNETLKPCQNADHQSILVLAVKVNNRVRLIDNGKLILQ